MKRYLTEFIGTFFLVFTATLAVARGTDVAWLAIGAALMVMVYMGGPISGAHYNPAVSLALLLRGKLPAADLLPYLGAQLAGAMAASGIGGWVVGRAIATAPSASATALQALAVEALFTFALCLVVLNVAASKRSAGNSYFGLAIGFTVAAAAFTAGPISGGVLNPAVGAGTILVSALTAQGSLANLWLYLVGPGLGAVAASWVFGVQEAGA